MREFNRLFVGPLLLALFAVVLSATSALASDDLVVSTIQVPLDETPVDIVADMTRGLAYVAVRSTDEILAIDIDTGAIRARYPITRPTRMALSLDGNYLYVTLASVPALTRVDLTDWSMTTASAAELDVAGGAGVVEISPGVVLMTANGNIPQETGLYRYDFNTGIAERFLTEYSFLPAGRMVYDGGDNVYTGYWNNNVYRLDVSTPVVTVVAGTSNNPYGASALVLSPDRSFLALAGGKKLRTTNLSPSANFTRGTPLFNDDGSLLYSAVRGFGYNAILKLSDPNTTKVLQRWETECVSPGLNLTAAFTKGRGSSSLLLAADDSLCIIKTETARQRPQAGGRFFDDDASIHQDAIDAIAAAGITKGCNPPYQSAYCPDEPVTRAQMAAFLIRGLGLSDAEGSNSFVDDDGSIFESDIARLAASGITRGCNPPENTKFCPDDIVTRGQMAAFLVRAMGYKRTVINIFDDDNGSVFEPDIDALASAGVTLGCNPPWNFAFCPDQPVTRAQMATFLARALKLIQDDIPERPTTTDGFNLDVRDKAADAGCTRANGEICEITQTVSGEFYLNTGVVKGNWYYLTEAQQVDFRSDKVRIDVTFDGKPLDLTTIPFIWRDTSGYKYWTFQFPAWLDGTHVLEIQYIDETTNYVWTIRDTLVTTGPGYDHEAQL